MNINQCSGERGRHYVDVFTEVTGNSQKLSLYSFKRAVPSLEGQTSLGEVSVKNVQLQEG